MKQHLPPHKLQMESLGLRIQYIIYDHYMSGTWLMELMFLDVTGQMVSYFIMHIDNHLRKK